MRPTVVISALTLALLAFLSLALLRPRSPAPDVSLNPGTIPSMGHYRYAAESSRGQPTNASAPSNAPAQAVSTISNSDLPEIKHQAYVGSRLAELQRLSMQEDAGSLETILSELTNRDPEIRAGALEAAIQFGSRDAIPRLLDAATQTDDPKEKAALADAVEFLKLPSLTEVLAQNKK